MQEPQESSPSESEEQRSAAIQQLSEVYLRRRLLGGGPTLEEFLSSHREFWPELREALATADLVERAFDSANSAARSRSSPQLSHIANASAIGMKVRCPHCHEANAAPKEHHWTTIVCPHCATEFSLVPGAMEVPPPPRMLAQHLELVAPLGIGGSGQVWKALDKERQCYVAVKLPHLYPMVPDQAERFLRESRAVAQLQHANIVPVLEVGRSGDILYIVTELVDGCSLAEWLTSNQLTAREAAKLCYTLALALDHSHQHGVVHRDLKPANVLIDQQQAPHLTDFGLAHHQRLPTITMSGEVVGTPAYMSPEQAQGESHHVDARTDVYALGMILFELLAGQVPFQGTLPQVIQQILTEEPSSPRKWNNTVPRDLAIIALKCLEKAPSRRYATARLLADDLNRFLTQQPIVAKPVSSARRIARWSLRHRALTSLLILLVSVPLVIAAVAMVVSHRSAIAKRRAEWERYLSDMHRAVQAWEDGQPAVVERLLEEHRRPVAMNPSARFEWRYLASALKQSRENIKVANESFGLRSVAFFHDGRRLAVCGFSTDTSIWDVSTMRRLRIYPVPDAGTVKEVAVSPDDRRLALGCDDGTVRIIDVESGATIDRLLIDKQPASWVQAVAYSGDGHWLAAASPSSLVLFDLFAGGPGTVLSDMAKSSNGVAISFDSRQLACVRGDEVVVWDIPTKQQRLVFRGHSGSESKERAKVVESVTFSRDGKRIASGDTTGTIRVWHSSDGTEVATLRGHRGTVFGLAFHQDGTLVSSSEDQEIRYWDVEAGRERAEVKIHNSTVNDIDISPDGTLLASVEYGGVIALTPFQVSGPPSAIRAARRDCWALDFSSDSRWLAAGYRRQGVYVFDVQTGVVVASNTTHFPIVELAFTPSHELVFATGTTPPRMLAWNWQRQGPENEPRIIRTSSGEAPWGSFDFSSDFTTLVARGSKERSELRAWPSLALRRSLVNDDEPGSVRISADGHQMIRFVGGLLRIFDSGSGRCLKEVAVHQGDISAAVCSPYTNLVATGGFDRAIRLIELPSGNIKHELLGHREYIEGLSFLADGVTLASASSDETVRLWDIPTGRELASFQTDLQQLRVVAASPDGRTIAASGLGDVIHLWRADKDP